MRMTKLQLAGMALLVGGLAVGLWPKPAKQERPVPAANQASVDARVPRRELPPYAVPLFAPRSDFRFSIFHQPEPKAPVRAKLEDLMSGAFKGLPVVSAPDDDTPLPYLSIRPIQAEQYPAPEPGDFYRPRKLSPEARSALESSRQVTVIGVHTAPPALGLMRQTHALVLELAQQTGGVIFDEQTGELFEPAAWKARRLEHWSGDVPLLARHIAINAYPEEPAPLAMMRTEGMSKFGLPDMQIKHVPPRVLQRMAGVLNLAAQVTLETGMLPMEGELAIDVDALEHAGLRESVQGTLPPNSKRKAKLTVSGGSPLDRVRGNRLLELSFERYPGKVPSEQQESFLTELYGSADEMKRPGKQLPR